MPSEEHERLNVIAAKWAKSQGFPVVATNVFAAGCRERIDVIAFRANGSLLIEAKVSRSDFLADAKKPERSCGGVGLYRFYITPDSLVSPNEVPDGWGLITVKGNKTAVMKGPQGNLWPPKGAATGIWGSFQHQFDLDAEWAILFSLARRLSSKKIQYL